MNFNRFSDNEKNIVKLNAKAKQCGLSYGEYVSKLTYKEECESAPKRKINSNAKKEG